MTLDDLPFTLPDQDPTRPARPPRKCYRHMYILRTIDHESMWACETCGKLRDDTVSRRNKNNGKRGRSDELKVARLVGGNKLGQLGLPWDVECPGYLRLQCKQLDTWPSIAKVLEWLDAIPAAPELRGVTLADTPGPGGKTRRVIIFDLEEWSRWHGK